MCLNLPAAKDGVDSPMLMNGHESMNVVPHNLPLVRIIFYPEYQQHRTREVVTWGKG